MTDISETLHLSQVDAGQSVLIWLNRAVLEADFDAFCA